MKVTPTPGSVAGRRVDRAGDPLEGLVNLFDLSLVLAVGLLLAALSSAGVVGLVSGGSGTGTPISGQPSGNGDAKGKGQAVGTVYRLSDGSYVFAPSGTAKAGTSGASPATGATSPTTSVPPSGATSTPPTAGGGANGLGTGTGTSVPPTQ
jgi:hypothetical protein